MLINIDISIIQKEGVKLAEKLTEDSYKEIFDIVSSIKYGSVTIIIQDGKIIQIDKNEKIRLK